MSEASDLLFGPRRPRLLSAGQRLARAQAEQRIAEKKLCDCFEEQASAAREALFTGDGLPLAEAGWYQEEMITAVLDLARADRGYALDSLNDPPFLKPYWEPMLAAVQARAQVTPE